MKKFLLFIVPILMTVAVKAQTAGSITIVNNEHCAIAVTQICYDASCNTTYTGHTVIVPSGTSTTLAIKNCSPDHPAYSVCWSGTICATPACAVVNGGVSSTTHPCYSNPVTLPNCGSCSASATGAKISFDASTNVLTAD